MASGDAWGNLTNRSGVTGKVNTEPLACPASNKNQLTTCSLNYDPAGNVTAYGTAAYTYDAENRLLSTAGVTYTYDGDGKRVKKSSGTLYWTGTGSDNLAESDLTATMQKEYIFFNGNRVARRDLSDGSVKYYFSDRLGSASVVTNAVGTMPPLEESDYYPYGGEISLTNGDPNTYKFTGKERDAESGLDEFGARYYASSLGRFMIPDWAAAPTAVPYAHFGNPQSLNLYGYVQNNPTTLGDPDGHCAILCTALIGAAVGAVIETAVELHKGEPLSGKRIGAAALGGAIAGATLGVGTAAGTALGLGANAAAAVEVTAGAAGNIAGGVAERGIDDGASAAFNGGEMVKDGAFGAAGAGLGKVLGKAGAVMAGEKELSQVNSKLGYAKLGAKHQQRLLAQQKVLQVAVAQSAVVAEVVSETVKEGTKKVTSEEKERAQSKHAKVEHAGFN